MGTDDLGRDLLTGVIHGIRTSVFVALAAGLIALPLGVAVGAIAGARGGLVDDVLMRLSEVWQVMPRFFLALMVIALFGQGLDRIVVVLGLTSWAVLARIVRAEILSIREREFVEAARALGMSEARILLRHMLPHAMPAAIVFVGLLLAQVCLIEASLGFLGLSDPNAISLGYLAGQAQRFLRVAWWMWFFPGLALITIVIGFNLVGDAINDRVRERFWALTSDRAAGGIEGGDHDRWLIDRTEVMHWTASLRHDYRGGLVARLTSQGPHVTMCHGTLLTCRSGDHGYAVGLDLVSTQHGDTWSVPS